MGGKRELGKRVVTTRQCRTKSEAMVASEVVLCYSISCCCVVFFTAVGSALPISMIVVGTQYNKEDGECSATGSALWLLIMGSVTLTACILTTICTPILGYLLKNNADRSRSKGATTCVLGSGCSAVLCLVASFCIQIWGSTLVYPEYASFDRDKKEWSDCQRVPVTFAFILITMTWAGTGL